MNPAAILLVTWIITGQTPASYQTPFPSMETCEAAKGKVLAEKQKMIDAENDYVADIKTKGVIQMPRNIMVTAVCAGQ
ncbi:MAG: hypothetical protein SFW62_02845 [Alphaproteobacteria bacterium]|nr:hypothetical protein [Alphaproteobacteria bacterium]